MPIPLLIVGGLALAGAAGVGVGAKGGADLARAHRIVDDCKADYEAAHARYTRREAKAAAAVLRHNGLLAEVQESTLTDWVDWLTAHEHQVRRLPHETVTGARVEVPDLPKLRRLVSPGGLAAGGAKAVVAGVAAQQVALAAVRAFAVAGTGAAISGLSGAAAQSATLAWLGGGTLAAGGGGVAAGGMVLAGVAVAPAALLGGITLAVQGDKALTQARAYRKDVRIALAQIDTAMALFDRLERRIDELARTITDTDTRASTALAALDELDFDPGDDDHVAAFQRTALLMRALSELLDAPLFEQADHDDTEGEAA